MSTGYRDKFRNLNDRALATAKLIRERQVNQETAKTVKQSQQPTEEKTHGRKSNN